MHGTYDRKKMMPAQAAASFDDAGEYSLVVGVGFSEEVGD